MATLEEIQQQIKALQDEAQQLIQAKKSEVLADILGKIKTYGLTAEDCGFSSKTAHKPSKAQTAKAPAQYRSPAGEEWAGGRGRKPFWVQKIIEEGGNIEDYKI